MRANFTLEQIDAELRRVLNDVDIDINSTIIIENGDSSNLHISSQKTAIDWCVTYLRLKKCCLHIMKNTNCNDKTLLNRVRNRLRSFHCVYEHLQTIFKHSRLLNDSENFIKYEKYLKLFSHLDVIYTHVIRQLTHQILACA